MIDAPISDNNFVLIAMHHYDNPQCTSIAEFEEDIKRFAYLKKLFGRYKDNGDLKERLILNHLIVLFNVFGVVTPELLFFKIDKQFWGALATFLLFLDRMPDTIPEFNIRVSDLIIDRDIANVLRKI